MGALTPFKPPWSSQAVMLLFFIRKRHTLRSREVKECMKDIITSSDGVHDLNYQMLALQINAEDPANLAGKNKDVSRD